MSNTRINETVHEGLKTAVKNRGLGLLVKVGYAARGVVYIILGTFAIQLGLKIRQTPVGQTTILLSVGHYPLGGVFLWLLFIGLVGYCLWGIIRAFFDSIDQRFISLPLHRRLGYLLSALTYGFIAFSVGIFLFIGRTESLPPSRGASQVLSLPLGQPLLLLVGLAGLGIGLGQVLLAWRNNLDLGLGIPAEKILRRQWLILVGRLGTAARGIIITIIGVSVIKAAYQSNPTKILDTTGAIYQLVWEPYGEIWLLLFGLGLILFGLYSWVIFFWLKLPWE